MEKTKLTRSNSSKHSSKVVQRQTRNNADVLDGMETSVVVYVGAVERGRERISSEARVVESRLGKTNPIALRSP